MSRRPPAARGAASRSATLALAAALAATTPTLAAQQPWQSGRIAYPNTRTVEQVDDYHGTRIADPYRWLEALDAPETKEWIGAQNAVTSAYLEKLPGREAIRRRITELWNYPKVTVPFREGGRIWYRRNSGLQRQSPVFSRASLAGEGTLVIDPNQLSPDGSVALQQYSPSPDGKLLAFGLAEGGADWQTVHVRDLATGKLLADTVRWMRFSGIAWTKDGKGFFYSRFPEPPKGKTLEAALGTHALYYHRVGTPQSEDRLIVERKDLEGWFVFGSVTDDGRYLFVYLSPGATANNRLHVVDLGDPMKPNVAAPVTPVVERDGNEFAALGTVGATLYLRTDLDAPNRRIVAVDLRDRDIAKWRTVVPEGRSTIEDAALAGGKIVLQHLVDVQSRLTVYALDGKEERTIPLPGVGSVAGIGARSDTPEMFFGFTSPLYPTTVFSYDVRTGRSAPFEAPSSPFDGSGYETRQFFAVSKDGTRVPYFVTARKGLALDGANPTMVYGYGGFQASMIPTYRPDVPAWLELGGVWVTASMRGGSEYGEEWHRTGMLGKKQNVFDDFIAVAEDLVRRRYTSPSKLAMMGGSNGGLLVGAVANQRPDLFAVALPAVGVMDMLRYDRFTGGAAWAVEYGASSDSAAFRWLRAYSPLHNIEPGTCYPATLVTTADHDDRVVPSHSFKYAAALQKAQGCDRPVLIRVEVAGSHGYRPTDKRIAELADQWSFTAANLGVAVGGRTP
jgi:prolyl oligopeptidase